MKGYYLGEKAQSHQNCQTRRSSLLYIPTLSNRESYVTVASVSFRFYPFSLLMPLLHKFPAAWCETETLCFNVIDLRSQATNCIVGGFWLRPKPSLFVHVHLALVTDKSLCIISCQCIIYILYKCGLREC
jgi:hypothetical protein